MTVVGALLLACAALFAGCALERAPLVPGRVDAPRSDVLDARPSDVPPGDDVPGLDAPLRDVPAPDVPLPDVPLPDAPGCVPTCDGEIADDCRTRRDCAEEDLTCRVLAAGPTCVCIDSPATCAEDGRAVESCVSGVESTELCDGDRCSSAMCSTTCDGVSLLVAGHERVNLCGRSADHRNERGGDCGVDAGGEDIMRRFEVPERSTVTVTLRDDDPAADVDTMVYVRDACFRFDSQVACDDDVPCAEAPDLGPCLRMPERQFRQSSLTTVLERGVYYVVADSITGTSDGITWGCGWVDLTVTITPMPE